MNLENSMETEPRILVVLCKSVLDETTKQAASKYTIFEDVDHARQQIEDAGFDFIVACVDPSTKESFQQLHQLQKTAHLQQTPLVTASPFNPVWIENLMEQFGVVAHFKGFPSKAQIADMVLQTGCATQMQNGGPTT